MKIALRNHGGSTRLLFSMGVLAFSFLITSCKDSSSVNSTSGTMTTSKANVRTFTGITNRSVSASSIFGKTPSVTGFHSTADSIVITRARVVINTLQLHPAGQTDDTIIIIKNEDDDHGKGMGKGNKHKDKDEDEKDTIIFIDRDDGTIRVGSFVAEFDGSGEKIISNVNIPPGVYDRIKFEIHKLNENDDPTLLNDSLFGDFVNGGRYTFIVEGFSYVNGVAYKFDFKSSVTAHVTIDINPPATFNANAQYDLRLVFDPKIIFGVPGMKPLDPRDPDNQEVIEQMLKNSILLLK
jgi:hypothetical protein